MNIGVRNPRVKLAVGQEVLVVHYKADGFLPRLAGIHNCSSRAWYLMRQADEYLEGWLHIFRIQTWHYLLLILYAAVGITLSIVQPSIGLYVLFGQLILAVMVIKRLQKSKLMLSGVACKSLAVQLMAEFQELADTEKGDV